MANISLVNSRKKINLQESTSYIVCERILI
jgi:hypothetical protein